MSVDLTTPTLPPLHGSNPRVTRRAARGERRRRARQDRVTARLAELHCIRVLIGEAITAVGSGWLQHDWFAVTDQRGHRIKVRAHSMHVLTGRPVSGACLVGAIVYAAGGPAAVDTQLVQRTLDLTWHARYEDERQPVQWCPAPAVRAAHVRDLTRWNDELECTAAEVTALLHRALRTANAQTDLLRARQARHG